ncbi:MAG: DNA repair protein RecO [Omnitrophica bacterium RIFCSPHIGHO2_02_FULL_46_11]|nr:MAG: DNA repair protein RecO [Omnitrophica bacterium RIFCSPHIGHO2_02_FULL_46_11]OGW87687.1 MAG: DNA repair protein RecO [Omnitrophica bacterium RIFCSPLOWO2_01_FULL_45_10b]
MAICREEAFVLKRVPLRETSLLVTLFSRGAGKIKGLAKGVRREKNSLAGRFEPFTRLSIVYYEKLKSDTHLISDATVLASNALLRDSLDRFSYSSYLVELVDALFGAHDPHPEVFNLLASSFSLLATVPVMYVARVFEVKALEMAGLLPILNHCVLCGKTDLERAFFSSKQGGLVCPRCDRGETATIQISKGTIQSLLFFLKNDIEQAVKLRLSLQTEKELERTSQHFLQYRLEYPLRSTRFLAEVKTLLKK